MTKPHLLYLAHRLPYPPHKGDKLRAYHFLIRLAESYDITLATLIDDPADWEHRGAFDAHGITTLIGDIRGRSKASSGLRALTSCQPVTYTHFHAPELMAQLKARHREKPFDYAVVFSSSMAPYWEALGLSGLIDFVDVDSVKWRDLAKSSGPLMKMVYCREWQHLSREEQRLSARADASVFVTHDEAALFRSMGGSGNIVPIENGVDLPYWAAAKSLPSPYPDTGTPRVILTGAMDYPPNIEAAVWFAREIMPAFEFSGYAVEFIIAGSNPTPEIEALASPFVTVTGRVEDMRPWLAHADLAIAPLKIARGVQNKVLEAMAAGTPIVVTSSALQGINAGHDAEALCADTAPAFAAQVARLLQSPEIGKHIAATARSFVEEHYDWNRNAQSLAGLIEDGLARNRIAAQ